MRLDCSDNSLIEMEEKAGSSLEKQQEEEGTPMAEFNADKLSERPEQLDLERLTMVRKLLEELLKDLERHGSTSSELGRACGSDVGLFRALKVANSED